LALKIVGSNCRQGGRCLVALLMFSCTWIDFAQIEENC
jgi:hypothetical protein